MNMLKGVAGEMSDHIIVEVSVRVGGGFRKTGSGMCERSSETE